MTPPANRQTSAENARSGTRRMDDPSSSPSQVAPLNARFVGHERQLHHRNHSSLQPHDDGYSQLPPGEEGQYGMRRSGAQQPWYNDPSLGSHSASNADSHYAEWRKAQLARFDSDYRDWRREQYEAFCQSFDAWRRRQTAPGTNVAAPHDRDDPELHGGARLEQVRAAGKKKP